MVASTATCLGLDLDGPPLVEDGDNSELSFGASYAILSREVSLDASLSVSSEPMTTR